MEPMKSNFTQEITLPSNGYLNPEIPEGKIIQRCMMVTDQKFLAGSNLSASTALHKILERTIESPADVDVSKLTFADTLYLLFKLRVLSYGNMYKFRTKCPECAQKIDVNLDLSELPVEYLEEDFSSNLVVKLPHSGDTVYTKLLTNGDVEEINKELKRRKRKYGNEDESDYVLRIAYSIEKIKLSAPNANGKTELKSLFDIERYIEGLTNLDAAAITATRDSVRFGILPTVEYVCPECGEVIDIDIHFTGDFFRPQFSK